MVSKTFGSAVHGVDAKTITVEVNVTQGKHFHMSGLPDNAVKESEHRVESSLKSLGYFMPRNKVVVNLAPADIRKEGSAYDLPLALCVLSASGQINASGLENYVIMVSCRWMVCFARSKGSSLLPFRQERTAHCWRY